jgi:lipopolysaccharide cholinephosphotransferase
MKWNKNDNSKYVNPLSGSYSYEKETNLRTTVLPVKKIKFEGKMYNGMTDNDTYLKKIYGDNYMELPPLEKRINHLPDTIIFPEEIENESKNKKRKNK